MKGGIIIGSVLVSVLVLTLVGGAAVYLMPEKPILPRDNVSTLIMNTAEYSSAYSRFAYIVREYNLEVDWSETIGDIELYDSRRVLVNNQKYSNWHDEDLRDILKDNVYYGKIENGKYDKAIVLFSEVSETLYPSYWFQLSRAIEKPISKVKFCKENGIKTIGVNFVRLSATGAVTDSRDNKEATYDVINEMAKYLDVMLVHYSEITDSRYYELAEKYGFELIVLGAEKPYSNEFWESEIVRYLKEMGV